MTILEERWDIRYIQRKELRRILESEKFTQCKTSRTVKIDACKIPDKIKILKSCLKNMNCFFFRSISNIDITISHTYSLPVFLTIPVKFYSSELKSLFKTILIMLFIGFPILPYLIWPHATTSIGYTKPYAKPSQLNLLSSYIKIIILYGANTLPIKKVSL